MYILILRLVSSSIFWWKILAFSRPQHYVINKKCKNMSSSPTRICFISLSCLTALNKSSTTMCWKGIIKVGNLALFQTVYEILPNFSFVKDWKYSYQNMNGVLHEIILKFAWKHKILQISKQSEAEKSKIKSLKFPNFKLYYKVTIIKTIWYSHKRDTLSNETR